MESIYDIAIIGAGPAGSALVKELSKIENLKIAIVDSRPLEKNIKIETLKSHVADYYQQTHKSS